MKMLTQEQVEGRKAKAVRFLRDVLEDDDRADEVEEESLDDYAERKHIQIENPSRKNNMATNAELKRKVRELEDENAELRETVDQIADLVAPDDDADADDDSDDADDQSDDVDDDR
ncbi:MAG: hypothetical protein H0X25_22155 [Acidobacteriales bacterium]|nr:hypothetical protein [Terriglobales bacterium]